MHALVGVGATTLDVRAMGQGVGDIDLVKIDAEGWELRILQGGRHTILERSRYARAHVSELEAHRSILGFKKAGL